MMNTILYIILELAMGIGGIHIHFTMLIVMMIISKLHRTTDGTDEVYLYSRTSSAYEGKGFYFTNSGNREAVPAFSDWIGYGDSDGIAKQNYYIYSGLGGKKSV